MAEVTEQKKIGLGELADIAFQVAEALKRHTDARNYFWQVGQGDGTSPIVTITSGPNTPTTTTPGAVLDFRRLPTEAAELLLSIAIEHEELRVIECWTRLNEISKQAATIVQQIMAQRQAQQAEVQSDEEFESPPTIPMMRTPDES